MILKQNTYFLDEAPAKEEDIKEFENLISINLPQEYKSFLKEINGCTLKFNEIEIEADTDWELMGLERFLSIGDLILQKKTELIYPMMDAIIEHNKEKYDIDFSCLFVIALGYQGCYYMHLGSECFGQIFYASYSDWDGFVKIHTQSFYEFLNSINFDKAEENEKAFSTQSDKVFDGGLFDTPQQPILGFNRFKEVLSFFGNPNRVIHRKNIPQHYVHNRRFLEYILEQGGKTDGLLNYAKDFETIQYLVKTLGCNVNKPYDNTYPLHTYLKAHSLHDHKVSYDLLDDLLQSDIDLDLTILDKEGNDFKTLLRKLNEGYQKYIQYDTKRMGYFNKDYFRISEKINEIMSL